MYVSAYWELGNVIYICDDIAASVELMQLNEWIKFN